MARTGRARLRSDIRGATLMEYALIAPVFFLALAAVLDYSYYFFKTTHLKHVLYEASRNIQTGELRFDADGDPRSTSELQVAFQNAYCQEASFLLDCAKISMDVRNFASLSAVSIPDAAFDDLGRPTNFVFQPGGSEEILVMRASIPHHFATPFMQDFFQPDGTPAIIVGQSLAKNEPF